ncbi:MAG: hypothetical protein B6240_15405 [Desulfobacteraceae bacterium 4572_87]|nr:MAG: hypothetical protein B6240_15405 [Desulfobacteraceae bacterium 4572_87]
MIYRKYVGYSVGYGILQFYLETWKMPAKKRFKTNYQGVYYMEGVALGSIPVNELVFMLLSGIRFQHLS